MPSAAPRIQERKKARLQRLERLRAAAKIVFTGKCPTCNTKLYRNMSMTGWYQCGHYGAPGFQKEAGPHCDFQLFYEPTPEEHSQILADWHANGLAEVSTNVNF